MFYEYLFVYLFTDLPMQKHYKDITNTLQFVITIRAKAIWQISNNWSSNFTYIHATNIQ